MIKYFYGLIIFFCFFCFYGRSQSNEAKTLLPEPTGIYNIGTKSVFLIDSSRNETLSRKKDFREFYVKIWYPVKKQEGIIYNNYLENYPEEVIADIFNEIGLETIIIEKVKSMHTFSSSELSVTDISKKYPLVIFNPGFYFGMTDFYTCIIENLVSNGYIVCSVNHPFEQPYVKQSDGGVLIRKKKGRLAYLQLFVANLFQPRRRENQEQIDKGTNYYLRRLSRFTDITRRWTKDSQFFLDYVHKIAEENTQKSVYSIMDLDNIGAFGHSIGGAVAGQLCVENKNLKAGINLDCFQFGDVINNPIEIPFMVMQSEQFYDWNLGNTVIYRDSKSDLYRLTLKNAKHFVFTDITILTSLIQDEEIIKLIGNVNTETLQIIIKSYILDFFNRYLMNIESEILDKNIDNEHINFEKVK